MQAFSALRMPTGSVRRYRPRAVTPSKCRHSTNTLGHPVWSGPSSEPGVRCPRQAQSRCCRSWPAAAERHRRRSCLGAQTRWCRAQPPHRSRSGTQRCRLRCRRCSSSALQPGWRWPEYRRRCRPDHSCHATTEHKADHSGRTATVCGRRSRPPARSDLS